MLTQSDSHLAGLLRARLDTLARALSVTTPLNGELGQLFDQTFARPGSALAYRSNQLQPEALPLEWSFSETDANALRFEFQPLDPMLNGQERLQQTVHALASTIAAKHGADQAAQFQSVVRSVAAEPSALSFGAFVGVVQRPGGADGLKIYVECDPQQPRLLDHGLATLGGITPHFVSIRMGHHTFSQRTYHLCHGGLGAADLEMLCNALGIGHRQPALVLSLLALTEGRFPLPPGSVLLGLKREGEEVELKLELLCGPALAGAGLVNRVEELLQPAAIAPFRRWATLVHPGSVDTLPVRVVSLTTSPAQPPRLSVYVAEPWSQG